MKAIIKRLLLISTIICSVAFTISETGKINERTDHVIAFFTNQFEFIKNRKFSINKNLYLKKKEIKNLFDDLDQKPPIEFINNEMANYRSYKKDFLKKYEKAFLPLHVSIQADDLVDWSSLLLDSITYNYTVIVNKGRDKKIDWPESKKYDPKKEDYTVCTGFIFCHNSNNKFIIRIFTLVYNQQFRFYRKLKNTRVQTLR